MSIPPSTFAPAAAATPRAPASPPPWIADLGDGRYRNPVLFADYSDPDAVRVGNDYWLTASSFSHVPGLPILHSRDLVNWTLVNHALPALVPREHFNVPRHGGGVWAPAIRFHAGRFWIFYADPDFGVYVVTANDPRAKWSEPILVKAGQGVIDPCPLWDTDGKIYLIHGWAWSRAGINNRVTLHQLSSDATRLLDEGTVIIDENTSGRGLHTLEGPKFYRRGDTYWVFAPVNGVASGAQAVYRSNHVRGPYEIRIVLAQGATPINGPHQGAWVDTSAGEDWFLHFQDRGPFGRVVHLQPMTWRPDGWPTMGSGVAAQSERGEPVLTHAKPQVAAAGATGASVPATSDEFDAPTLGLQWQWQANPRPEFFSLTARPGSLRLYCLAASASVSLYDAPHLLLQKFPGARFTATTVLDFSATREGDQAGLIVFGYCYAWIGLRQTVHGLRLVQHVNVDASHSGIERESAGIDVTSSRVFLRVAVGVDATCCFSFSTDGQSFAPFGEAFAASAGKWVGAKLGLFASAASVSALPGHAEFDFFRVTA